MRLASARRNEDWPEKKPVSLLAQPEQNQTAATQVMRHALTVDVEDYFQVEAFANVIDRREWDHRPRRVDRNTEKLLELFGEAGARATFFMLGWVAQRHPDLVHRIVAGGHELASHGHEHFRADQQSPEQFRADVRRSKSFLEDIAGVEVIGYRAPTFSVGPKNRWAHTVLAEEGFRYSSSVYPIAHDLYGVPHAPRRPFCPQPGFVEIPLTTARVLGRNLPSAGGGYFRLLPYTVARAALRRAARELGTPCVFYMHPWEIDPDQPRVVEAPPRSRFRHYLNLRHTEGRLRRLLQDFGWDSINRVFLSSASVRPPLMEQWLACPPL
jgi:polysaccharide deacetylase family protein (PEP-CTERM system associated)